FAFLLLLPHDPTTPPFPYTTLFRSAHLDRRGEAVDDDRAGLDREGVGDAVGDLGFALDRNPFGAEGAGPGGEIGVGEAGSRHERDRKSTRLNSSHQIISYAVFCLKK